MRRRPNKCRQCFHPATTRVLKSFSQRLDNSTIGQGGRDWRCQSSGAAAVASQHSNRRRLDDDSACVLSASLPIQFVRASVCCFPNEFASELSLSFLTDPHTDSSVLFSESALEDELTTGATAVAATDDATITSKHGAGRPLLLLLLRLLLQGVVVVSQV